MLYHLSIQNIHTTSAWKLASAAWPSRRNFDGFADNLAKKNDSLIHYLLFQPSIWIESSIVSVRRHFPPNTFSYFEGFEYNFISWSSIGQRYRSQNYGLKPTDHFYAYVWWFVFITIQTIRTISKSYFCVRVVHGFVLQISPKKRAQRFPFQSRFQLSDLEIVLVFAPSDT